MDADIAFELFKKSTNQPSQVFDKSPIEEAAQAVAGKGWYERLFRGSSPTASNGDKNAPVGIARQKLENLKESDRAKLEGYYVRIRYNDKVMSVPGCKAAGKHLDGDESFCTLVSILSKLSFSTLMTAQEAFKGIVDKYTPSHWKQACLSNMEVPAFPENPEPAGY